MDECVPKALGSDDLVLDLETSPIREERTPISLGCLAVLAHRQLEWTLGHCILHLYSANNKNVSWVYCSCATCVGSQGK
jgi:hypothetical protein